MQHEQNGIFDETFKSRWILSSRSCTQMIFAGRCLAPASHHCLDQIIDLISGAGMSIVSFRVGLRSYRWDLNSVKSIRGLLTQEC